LNVETTISENFCCRRNIFKKCQRDLYSIKFWTESVNNTIFGFNTNFAKEVPDWLINYSIDTDVPSNLSVRAEVAFLKPDSPKSGSNFRTAHVDDFEGSQTTVTAYPLSWSLASRRLNTSSNYDFNASA
jgi:cell surface protein SprA